MVGGDQKPNLFFWSSKYCKRSSVFLMTIIAIVHTTLLNFPIVLFFIEMCVFIEVLCFFSYLGTHIWC